MLHADRWAARYAFLRELWAGRSRVIADPAVEAALRGAKGLPPALAGLLAELLPGGAGGGQAWLLAYEAKASPGRARPRVVEFDAFEDLLAEAPWQVAVVDLARHFVEAQQLSRFAARAQQRLENRLDTRAFRLLTALSEGAEAGRLVVVAAPGEAAGGLDLAQFQDLVTQHFRRARVYAFSSARTASVVDCGEVTSEEEEDEEDDRGPVPLAYDNSLGDEPAFDGYLAVIGAREVPRGVTLLELPEVAAAPAPVVAPAPVPAPAPAKKPEPRRDDELEALRGQLSQAKRQLELASIARQSLVEQLDAAQSRIDALEDQLAEGQEPAAAGAPVEEEVEVEDTAPEAAPQRADVAAATIHALRWELEQARGELRRLTARPTEATERALAEARARLSAVRGTLPTLAALVDLAGGEAAAALAEELQALHDRLRDAAGEGDAGPLSPS